MGLAEQIQSAISSGMKALDTIRKVVTYHSTGIVSYDSSAGTNSESGGLNIENVYATFTSYKIDDIDGQIIHTNDKKALIPKLDLSVVPKETDYLLDSNSIRWDVKNIKIDPAEALWTLQVRRHADNS